MTRGVRRSIVVIVAGCQRAGRWAATSPAGASVIGVALLAPRVAVGVIAAQFPEAGGVGVCELQAVDPLGRFPEIEMRHQKPRRSTMIGGDRLAVVFHC